MALILSKIALITGCLFTAQPQSFPVRLKAAPGSIHEADEQDLKVLAHINDLQREIAFQINLSTSQERIRQLQALSNELADIAHDYTQLAPGTAFLGPFSSVSLVLKQRELQKRITKIEKQICTLN